MPSDNTNKEDSPPIDDQIDLSSDEGKAPAEWTLTEEDIREIKASGLTLQDVMRELKLDCGPE